MQLLQLLQIVLLTIAGSAIATPVLPRALPVPVDGKEARKLLSQLTVAVDVNNPTYDRKYFKHWVTVDGNCTARQYVLKRDGTSVVTDSKCNALSGTWLSVYDDISITDPSKIDIDHIVPLKEAWVSGARHWNDQKREDFANDIKLPQLVAVSQRSNRAKGDKDPARWLPPDTNYHCTYARAWVQVKHSYGLTVDQDEKDTLVQILKPC